MYQFLEVWSLEYSSFKLFQTWLNMFNLIWFKLFIKECTAMDCSECDPDDPTVCVTCSEGYRKDSNGDCKCKNIFPGSHDIVSIFWDQKECFYLSFQILILCQGIWKYTLTWNGKNPNLNQFFSRLSRHIFFFFSDSMWWGMYNLYHWMPM